MSTELTPPERRKLAEQLGLSPAYLWQCLTGRRDMGPAEARRVERESRGRLKRWDLCQRTWYAIWPELKNKPGHPPIPPFPSGASANDDDEAQSEEASSGGKDRADAIASAG